MSSPDKTITRRECPVHGIDRMCAQGACDEPLVLRTYVAVDLLVNEADDLDGIHTEIEAIWNVLGRLGIGAPNAAMSREEQSE